MAKIVKTGNRGYALMLVLGMVALMASTIACLSILTRGRVDDLQLTLDRTTAYYLCESGASQGVLDIRAGTAKAGSPGYNSSTRKITRTLSFPVTNHYSGQTTTYTITYEIYKEGGAWRVRSKIPSPYNMGYLYTLTVGGQRAFPFFIKEMGAGLGGM